MLDNYKKNCLNDLIRKMEGYKKEYEAKIELWKKVKRVYKKDGTNFASFGKNFEGASVTPERYSIRENYNLTISDYVNGVYISDDIELYPNVRYYKHSVADDRIIKTPLIEAYFKMTIEETFEAINDRIELYSEYIKELEKNISDAEKVYTAFTDAIDAALKDLKTAAGNNSTLYFECRHYMEKEY